MQKKRTDARKQIRRDRLESGSPKKALVRPGEGIQNIAFTRAAKRLLSTIAACGCKKNESIRSAPNKCCGEDDSMNPSQSMVIAEHEEAKNERKTDISVVSGRVEAGEIEVYREKEEGEHRK